MGLSTAEKIGLGIAGLYVGGLVGSYFFPETFYSGSFGLLGAEGGQVGTLQPSSLLSTQTLQSIPSSQGGLAALSTPTVVGASRTGESVIEGARSLGTGATVPESTGFLGQLQQGFTSPQGIGALLTAGASLGNTLLAQDAEKDRLDAQKEEAEKGREFSREEAERTREFTAEQNRIQREFTAEQRAADREFREEQERKTQQLQAIIAEQNRRTSLVTSRLATAGRRRGIQGAGAISQALLA